MGKEYLEGEWRSVAPPDRCYQIVERGHEMRHEWWGGCSRHNKLYRQTYTPEGGLLGEELLVENHAMMMYQRFLEEQAQPEASNKTDSE